MKTFKDYLKEAKDQESLEKKILSKAKKDKNYLGYAYAIMEDINYHSENREMEAILGDDEIEKQYKTVDRNLVSDYSQAIDWGSDLVFMVKLIELATDKNKAKEVAKKWKVG